MGNSVSPYTLQTCPSGQTSECPQGLVCSSDGYCIGPARCGPTGAVCASNQSCLNGQCVNNTCSQNQCLANQQCMGSSCVNIPFPQGYPACGPDGTPCGVYETCVNGQCIKPSILQSCRQQSDCSGSQQCEYGWCMDSYMCHPTCAPGSICNNSAQCITPLLPPSCELGCPTGQICTVAGCVDQPYVFSATSQADCDSKNIGDTLYIDGRCHCYAYGPVTSGWMCTNQVPLNNSCSNPGSFYTGSFRPLDGYMCDPVSGHYSCGGKICPYGMSCQNGTCVFVSQ